MVRLFKVKQALREARQLESLTKEPGTDAEQLYGDAQYWRNIARVRLSKACHSHTDD